MSQMVNIYQSQAYSNQIPIWSRDYSRVKPMIHADYHLSLNHTIHSQCWLIAEHIYSFVLWTHWPLVDLWEILDE